MTAITLFNVVDIDHSQSDKPNGDTIFHGHHFFRLN